MAHRPPSGRDVPRPEGREGPAAGARAL